MVKVFVAGAAGKTGISIIQQLVGKSQVEVYAGVYSGKKENQEESLRSTGVKNCVPIDAGDYEGLVDAFKGMDALFIIPPAVHDKVHYGKNYIKSAKDANVPFVVLISIVNADSDQYLWAKQFHSLESYLKDQFPSVHCIVQSSFYMENFLLFHKQIKEGFLPLSMGENGKFSPISVEDVGAVAARILIECKNYKHHYRSIYTLTGPTLESGHEMAKSIGSALGKEIKFQNVSPNDCKKIITEEGSVSESEAQAIVDYLECIQNESITNTCSNTVHTIVKREPLNLEKFIQKHKSKFF